MFVDREDAGRRLGLVLRRDLGAERDDVVVVGLSPGGIAVASEVAGMLGASLDALAVRELHAAGEAGGAFGAIGEGGVRVLDNTELGALGLTEAEVRAAEFRERLEMERLADRIRGERLRTPLSGKIVVVVDDGEASVPMARVACAIARADGAARLVLAIPRIRAARRRALSAVADELVTLEDAEPVGQLYETPYRPSDDEMVALVARWTERPRPFRDKDVEFEVGSVTLRGRLSLGWNTVGMVVLASDDGGRHGPRNAYVASRLRRVGLNTLLIDLLTGAEELEHPSARRVDVLGERLASVTSLLRRRAKIAGDRIGLFGSGTGADAALAAAAHRSPGVGAVVACGGRPDPLRIDLGRVHAPTLLIVAGGDRAATALNRRAADRMLRPGHVWVVEGVTNLQSEPGVLEAVSDPTCGWFGEHLLRRDRADAAGCG